jgi:hypothetical protein
MNGRTVLVAAAAAGVAWAVTYATAYRDVAVLHKVLSRYREAADREHQPCANTIGRLSVALRKEQAARRELERSLAAHQDYIDHLERLRVDGEDPSDELRRLTDGGGS